MVRKRILMIGSDPAFYQWLQSCLYDYSLDLFYTQNPLGSHFHNNKNEYVLVIMDMEMADAEILHETRAMFCLPILIFSEKLSSANQAALLRAGADVCLQKPVDADVCAAQVYSLTRFCESTSGQDAGILVVNSNFLIDSRRRKVFINNRTVELTRKEFDMLLFFVKHPEQVFGANQLYEQIWNEDFAVSGEDTVKVHIKRLRKKLRQAGENCIQNVWGVGYRFVTSGGEL